MLKKNPENLSQYEIRVVCGCAFANVLFSFQKEADETNRPPDEGAAKVSIVFHSTEEE